MARQRAAVKPPDPVADALDVAVEALDLAIGAGDAMVHGDRVAIGDGVRVRFVSREEWEAAAWVLVEVDKTLTAEQLDLHAKALADTGLANLAQVLIFDRTTRVRLVPGEAEWRKKFEAAVEHVGELGAEKAALEHRIRELGARLVEANERVAALSRSLAARNGSGRTVVAAGSA